jgi:hypothetical protein
LARRAASSLRCARILQIYLQLLQENQRDLRETCYPRLVTKEPVKSRPDAMGLVQALAEITGLKLREGYACLRH